MRTLKGLEKFISPAPAGKKNSPNFPPKSSRGVLQTTVIFVNGTLIESWFYAVVRIHRSLQIKNVGK